MPPIFISSAGLNSRLFLSIQIIDAVRMKELRSILLLDMSFTLSMFQERDLLQALDSRKLNGYFSRVISVHPLAGLFGKGDRRFGGPEITNIDGEHCFVEGTIGISRLLSFFPALNLLLAQVRLLFFLRRMARDAKVDVIRIGDPYYLGIFGWLLSKLLGVPLVARTCFDYDLLYATSRRAVFPRLFRFRCIEKAIERFVFPRCDVVAGANENNLEYAIANGAIRERGVVFRYGNLIHPIHFSEPNRRGDISELCDELKLTDTFMMTVSRLERMKQPEDNLYVLHALREAGHNIIFLFVGDGSMREQLTTIAENLGVLEQVRFAGNRSQETIAKLLPHARLVLSPHMGRGLAEACLAGSTIVAYDYDWQGEIIVSGETGELVSNGDWRQMATRAIWLLKNPEERARRGRAARLLALKMMSPDKLNRHEISVYEKLFRNDI